MWDDSRFCIHPKIEVAKCCIFSKLAERKTRTINVKWCSKTRGVAVQPDCFLSYKGRTEIQLLHAYSPPFPAHVLGIHAPMLFCINAQYVCKIGSQILDIHSGKMGRFFLSLQQWNPSLKGPGEWFPILKSTTVCGCIFAWWSLISQDIPSILLFFAGCCIAQRKFVVRAVALLSAALRKIKSDYDLKDIPYQACLGTRPEQTWLTSFGCCWTERWNERGSSSLRWSDDQMYCTSIFYGTLQAHVVCTTFSHTVHPL